MDVTRWSGGKSILRIPFKLFFLLAGAQWSLGCCYWTGEDLVFKQWSGKCFNETIKQLRIALQRYSVAPALPTSALTITVVRDTSPPYDFYEF